MCIKHVCIKFNFNLLFKLHRKPWNCDTYSGIEINKFMFFIFMFLSFFFFCHYILRKLNISLHTHHTVSFLNSASLCRRWSAFSCFLSSFLDLDATFRANSLCFSSLSLYKKNNNTEMINIIWVYCNVKVTIIFIVGAFQCIIFDLIQGKYT